MRRLHGERSPGSLLRRGDELDEQIEVDGLRDVVVEARGTRPLPVVILAVAGRRDEHAVLEISLPRGASTATSYPFRPGNPMSRSRTSGRNARATSMAAFPSWAISTSCPAIRSSLAMPIAVSTLSSTTRIRFDCASPACRGFSVVERTFSFSAGSRTANSLPSTEALARCLDAPAVHLDQFLDHRKADSQPAPRPVERLFDLSEELEDLARASPG